MQHFSTSSAFLTSGWRGLGGGVQLKERDSLSKNQERYLSLTLLPVSDLTQSWIFPLASEALSSAQLLWQGIQVNRPNIWLH